MHRFSAITISLLLAAPAFGQLSGSYSLNPSQATGGTNFKSFTDLGTALSTKGVKGPVVVRVAPGTIKESFVLPYAKGASATNTITIQSLIPLKNSVKLQGTTSDTLRFKGSTASSGYRMYYILDNLTFVSSPSLKAAIFSDSYAFNIEVRNCIFGSGNYRCLYLRRGYDSWKIHHNEFTCQLNQYGLYMSQIRNSEIHSNRIDLNGARYGMFFINYNDARNKVYNNLFFGKLGSGAAINMAASNYNNLVHNNTFAITTLTGVAIYTQGFTLANRANIFRDNIILVLGGGACIRQYPSTTTLWPFTADNNIYFAPGGAVGIDRTRVAHKTLAAWQKATGQDKNSKQVDPQLLRAGVPYDLRIKESSPAVDAARYAQSYIKTDHWGEARGGKVDIGADEVVVRSFGNSCKGSLGKAPVHASTGEWKLGTTNFYATISNAPGGVIAAAFFGFSNKTWGATPLPWKLPGGCEVLTSMDLVFGQVTDKSGNARFQMTVPNDVRFAGMRFFTQGFAVDKGAVLSFTLSNALSLDT